MGEIIPRKVYQEKYASSLSERERTDLVYYQEDQLSKLKARNPPKLKRPRNSRYRNLR